MSKLSRRLVLAAVVAALAVPALAADGKTVELAKAFPYLQNYLEIPAAQRSRFTVAYYITQGGKPAAGLKAWIVDGAQRTPLPISADGLVLRSPSLGQLRAKAKLTVDAPPTTKFGIELEIQPLMHPSVDLDAALLIQSITQADAGVRKAAGLLGFAAPKLTRIYFKGGSGAEAVWADGRHVKLGALKGMAFFDPVAQRGAKSIHFARAPERIEIGPAG